MSLRVTNECNVSGRFNSEKSGFDWKRKKRSKCSHGLDLNSYDKRRRMLWRTER